MGVGERGTPGGAHSNSGGISAEEALARELARNAEYRARPDVIAWEAMRATGLEKKRQARLRERGKPELYGPPNPYKPHRRAELQTE